MGSVLFNSMMGQIEIIKEIGQAKLQRLKPKEESWKDYHEDYLKILVQYVENKETNSKRK